MRVFKIVKLTFAAAVLLASCCPDAEKTDAAGANAGNTWKKRVTRTVDLVGKEDTIVHHLKPAANDSSLIALMITAIKAGQLTAYSNIDNQFTTKMTATELNDLLGARTDTILLTDPVTGDEVTRVVKQEFNSDAVHKYRLLEEWTLNPATGKTEIQIKGIAPVREIYNDNGELRGVQAMFWLKYDEAKALLTKSDRSHPERTLTDVLWDDYFLSDVKPEAVK